MTRDYKRHGITHLFAARNVAAGEVPCNTSRSYKATDVLAFLKLIDLRVPLHLKDHVLVHNLSAHKITSIAPCLADRRYARWHQHFTPAPSSSLDVFNGSSPLSSNVGVDASSSPRSTISFTAINTWAGHWNADPKSVPWRNPADQLVPTMKKKRSTLVCVRFEPHH